MKTEIIITIKLPLFKRWILRAFIGGLLINLEKSRKFYKEHAEYIGIQSAAGKDCIAQKQGIEQSINAVRLYCGMRPENFDLKDWLDEVNNESSGKA